MVVLFFLNVRWGLVGHVDMKEEVDLRAKPFTEKVI